MDKFMTPWEFWDEINKRPDIQEIMRRLADSGWDDPSAYDDPPYVTDDSDNRQPDAQQQEQADKESGD